MATSDPITIRTLNLELAADENFVLVWDGSDRHEAALWLEHTERGWTLNDANTAIPFGEDEDLRATAYEWIRSVDAEDPSVWRVAEEIADPDPRAS